MPDDIIELDLGVRPERRKGKEMQGKRVRRSEGIPWTVTETAVAQTLAYARPKPARPSKAIRRLAFASLFLPAFVVASLYGEWLLAAWSLGHTPRPSLDDPMHVVGSSWMYGVTVFAILGAVPAALAAFALNVAEIVVNRPSVPRGAFKITLVIVSWSALFALLRWDPGAVLDWWLD